MRIGTKTALAFAAFAVACVVGSGGLLIREFREGLEEALLERQVLLVSNRALVLRENLALASGEMERLAAMAEIDLDDENPGPEQRLLAQAYRQTSFFNAQMELYDARGRCRWAEPEVSRCASAEVSATPWFRDAVRRPHGTDVHAGGAERPGLVEMVTPVVRRRGPVGVLRGVIDLHGDLMFSPALHDELSEATTVALFDADGRALLPTERGQLSAEGDEIARAGLRRGGSGASIVSTDRETRLVSWAPVGRAGLGLVFSWPLAALDGSEERHVRSLVTSITIVGLLALLTGFVTARALTLPLRRLAAHVRGVRSRRIESLPLTDSADEVGDVQRALRGLLVELDEREREIRLDRDRIAELASQLEERIEARTRELHEAQDALVGAERMAAIGRAGTVISHELRNALNAVSVAMDTLGTESDPDSQKTARRLVRGEIARLRKLSDELIRYAREPVLEREQTSMADLVEIAALLIEEHARDSGVEVETRVEGTPRAMLDADLIQTVLVNLLRNAVDAAAGREPALVRLAVDATARELRITIEDSGAGIAESVRERLFQPFVTSRRQGLGLGLAIADRLVVAHGGRIELGSSSLGGALFCVRLPVDHGVS